FMGSPVDSAAVARPAAAVVGLAAGSDLAGAAGSAPLAGDEDPVVAGPQAVRPSRTMASSQRCSGREITSGDPVDQVDVDLVALVGGQVDGIALRIPDAVLGEPIRRPLIERGGIHFSNPMHQLVRVRRQD